MCRARFRGSRVCSRCGAELDRLMTLTVEAWKLRQQTRAAIRTADYAAAEQFATSAQALRATSEGAFLLGLARWLRNGPPV